MIGMNWMKRAPHSVAQEAVDVVSVLGVRGVDRRQRVPLDTGVREIAEAAHDLIERAFVALVDAVRIVQLPLPVDREPDQEVVLLEERGPLLVEKRPVRLQRVRRPLARLQVLLRQLDRAAEEVEPHQRRLAALPRDRHLQGRTRVVISARRWRWPPCGIVPARRQRERRWGLCSICGLNSLLRHRVAGVLPPP
ncbi:MAG TPA: hypothetical protein VIR59_13350 [Gaiellaceae bacterium]